MYDEQGTRFEFECYDVSHLYNLAHMLDRGLVQPPIFVQTVLGILGGIGSDVEDLLHLRRTAQRLFGDEWEWSVLGAGSAQIRLGTIGLALGSNVRVGLEDSLWDGPGRLAESSQVQVERIQTRRCTSCTARWPRSPRHETVSASRVPPACGCNLSETDVDLVRRARSRSGRVPAVKEC